MKAIWHLVMLITHDMGVVSEMADCSVMYAIIVEYAQSAELFTNPLYPTQGLLRPPIV